MGVGGLDLVSSFCRGSVRMRLLTTVFLGILVVTSVAVRVPSGFY